MLASFSFFLKCLRGSRGEFWVKNQSLSNVLEHTFSDTAFCADFKYNICLIIISSYYDKKHIEICEKDQERVSASSLSFIRKSYPRKNVVFMVLFDTVFEALSNETKLGLDRDFCVMRWQRFWYEYATFDIRITNVIDRKYQKDNHGILSYIPFDREKKELSFDI